MRVAFGFRASLGLLSAGWSLFDDLVTTDWFDHVVVSALRVSIASSFLFVSGRGVGCWSVVLVWGAGVVC